MDNQTNFSQEYFWNLLSKKLAGEATAGELEAIETVLLQNPDLQHQADMLSQMWKQNSNKDLSASEATYMRHLMKHKEDFFTELPNIDQEPLHFAEPDISKLSSVGKFLLNRTTMAFAAIVIVLVSSWLIFFNGNKKEDKKAVATAASSIVTKNGNRTKITLPDGTQVWLNAGSKLDYNNLLYNKNSREVTLSGEAYFDVVKNADKPFFVHTHNFKIKVLGTAFDVKSYPEDKESETSLIRGSLEVTVPGRQAKFILSPNDKLVVNNRGNNVFSEDIETEKIEKPVVKEAETIISFGKVNYLPEKNIILETAWVENRLEFRSEKFIDVAKKMERWFDVTISFKDKRMENIILTGTLPTGTIAQALEALKFAESLNYTIEGNNIIIKP